MPWWSKNGSEKAEQKVKLEHKLLHAKQTPEPVFDLTECGLKEVPSGVYSWCKVCLKQSLLLQDNILVSLSGGGLLKDLALLKILDLHNNKLNDLPSDIGSLISLEVLYLGNNELKSLPESFVQLKNLQTLYLNANKFYDFPEVVCGLKRLRTLHITNNAISKLPQSLATVRTLDTLALDNEIMVYPDSHLCSKGTEAIMKFLCKESGIEFIPPSMAIYTSKEESSTSAGSQESPEDLQAQSYWAQLELRKEQKRRERIQMELQLKEDQTKQACVVADIHLNRLQLLDAVCQNQSQLERELQIAQRKKDENKQNLIENLVRVEQESNQCIAQLLEIARHSLNHEAILEAEKRERKEFEEVFLIKQEAAAELRRKEVLDAMMKSLQENDQLRVLDIRRKENEERVLQEQSDENTHVQNVLSRKDFVKDQLISQVINEENLQKEAFVALLSKRDTEYNRVRDQLDLIYNELSNLTLLELKQRDLKIGIQMKTIEEKRKILSELLVQLQEQQKQRREELKRRLEEMEARRLSGEQDYWLHQYQRLMDHKPASLIDLENSLDPAVRELLIKAGVEEYVPLFAQKRVTLIGLCALGADGIRELGVANRAALSAIVAALEELRSEKLKAVDATTDMEAPTTSTKTVSKQIEMNAHLEMECVVCMEQKCCLLFLTCGHVCCCEACGRDMTKCPMCRGDIVQTIILHFSN